MASKTTLNWGSYFFSSASSSRARSLCVDISFLSRTKVRSLALAILALDRCPGKKRWSYFIKKVCGTDPLSFLPVLAGKDGLELRDTQQVGVRGDYEVGMFGQSGSQVEAIIVNESIFL